MAHEVDLTQKTVLLPDLGDESRLGQEVDLVHTDGSTTASGVIVVKEVNEDGEWKVYADVYTDSLSDDDLDLEYVDAPPQGKTPSNESDLATLVPEDNHATVELTVLPAGEENGVGIPADAGVPEDVHVLEPVAAPADSGVSSEVATEPGV